MPARIAHSDFKCEMYESRLMGGVSEALAVVGAAPSLVLVHLTHHKQRRLHN